MSEPLKTPRGTRDLLPHETAFWRQVEAKAHAVFARYGYREIRTPLFEATELFSRGIGEGTDIVSKEMYTFADRKERSLTLRPEGTAGVVRAYIEHHLGAGESGEAKLYYLGPMFRYERPQAGRYRQFWQLGAEFLGASEPAADAETIALLMTLLRETGLSGLQVDINSVGCADCRPAYNARLLEHLQGWQGSMSAESRQRLSINPMRVLDSKDPQDAELVAGAPKITNHLCSACSAHFAGVQRHLDRMGVPFEVNKKLVRGLDYYSRTAFEVLSDQLGSQSAVAGGGRYDSLVGSLGGADRPGVGFGIGMDRLLFLLEKSNALQAPSATQVAVLALGAGAQGPGLGIAQTLREQGVSVWMDLSGKRGMKSQIKAAAAEGVAVSLILGEDELARGVCGLKDMRAQAQSEVSLENAVKEILDLLASQRGNA